MGPSPKPFLLAIIEDQMKPVFMIVSLNPSAKYVVSSPFSDMSGF